VQPDCALGGPQRIWAHHDALRKVNRGVIPLNHLDEADSPCAAEGGPHDRLVEFPELEPGVGGVLIFDFKDDKPAFSRAARNAVGLAPPDRFPGGEAEPGGLEVTPM